MGVIRETSHLKQHIWTRTLPLTGSIKADCRGSDHVIIPFFLLCSNSRSERSLETGGRWSLSLSCDEERLPASLPARPFVTLLNLK